MTDTLHYSPDAPDHFCRELNGVQEKLEAGGWVEREPFPHLSPETPERLVEYYQGLVSLGYARRWFS